MSEVEQYQFGDREIRVIDRNGEPWWIARDVCDVLAIVNVGDAMASLDDDERSNIANPDVARGGRPLAIINESGLYSLILRSRKPEAKAFKKWVTSEVLPSIRHTGSYRPASVNIELTINALAELAYKEHVIPAAGRMLALHRWRKTRKGMETFVQLTLDVKLPGLEGGTKREITGGNESEGR